MPVQPHPPGVNLIVHDFLEVIYLDSTALETIRRFGETCRKSGIDVIIFGLGEQPRSLFARTGADHEFDLDHVVESRRQALDLVIWRRITRQNTPPDSVESLVAR